MNTFVVITFLASATFTNAGVLVGPSAKILQGPSSKTTVFGPEGSVISAVAPGGQIVHEEHPGVVAHSSLIVAHASPVVAYAARVVAHAAPVVAHVAPVVDHAAPATVIAHSSAYENDDVVVAGPSGTIATGRLAHAAPIVAHAAPVLARHAAHAVTFVAHGDVYNNGYEGQYLHDHSEALYDDGSYRLYH